MKPGLPYKPYIDSAILHLLENGEIHKSRTKWWKQKRGGGNLCILIILILIFNPKLKFFII